jgi:hypothetical protein
VSLTGVDLSSVAQLSFKAENPGQEEMDLIVENVAIFSSVRDDSDNDWIPYYVDNCRQVHSPGQTDCDCDWVGDTCDNCPADFNPDQQDSDGNGVGDACETCPGDFDGDGDVDLNDYQVFTDCMAGPNASPNPAPPITPQDCLDVFDFDIDNDLDLPDFAGFQASFTGS